VDDPARRLLLVSIVVAAALQNEWGFSLDLYLPEADRIAADQVAAELGLPSPAEDFGRPCLRATSRMLQRNAPFPFNFESGWEDSVHRLLSQLKRSASRYGT
jgi:hypothetical protein